MSNVNSAVFSGNVAADPLYKEVGQGNFPIAELRVAVNKSRKQEDGSYAETASFLDVTVLGEFAKLVDRKVRKGDPVTVQAEIEQQRWTTEDGSNRSKVVFLAREIDGACFYKKDDAIKPKEEGNGSSSSAPAAAAAAPSDDDIPF